MAVIIGMTALNARLSAISGPSANRVYMGQLGIRTVAAMKQRIAHKTRTTSRSLAVGRISADRVEIVGNQNALWLEQGTKPHIIRPKSKKALAWAASPAGRRLSGRARVSTRRGGNGGMAFATLVHHPGTKAQPYIRESVQEAFARSGMAEAVIRRWDDAA